MIQRRRLFILGKVSCDHSDMKHQASRSKVDEVQTDKY